MSLSEIGRSGQRVDVLNGGDVAADGRLLSVGEIQQAFHELVARKTGKPVTRPNRTGPEAAGADAHWTRGAHATTLPGIDDERQCTASSAELSYEWVCVVAAHAGAGASTVALAIADAAEHGGRVSHLIDTALPHRSGLVAATTAEMGLDRTGTWRRGYRGRVTIDRRASDDKPTGWPATVATDSDMVVIDLGLPTPDNLSRLAASRCRLVVVCRPTVPGVRLAEQLLMSIPTDSVTVVSIGGAKWPHEVTASLGPRVRELRTKGAVVAVPIDRRLAVTGPTNGPLPKSVAAAGRTLLTLLDATRSVDATPDSRRQARSASARQRHGAAR